MSSKLTSYQKLKLENTKLKSDIYTLVHNPDSIKSAELIIANKLKKQFEEAIMFGSVTDVSEYKFAGLLNIILEIPNETARRHIGKDGVFNYTEKDIM